MKYFFYISLLAICSCAKQNTVYEPENNFLTDNEMEVSKNRTKDLNNLERAQIEDWIKSQSIKYYPMGMNYWVNAENLDKFERKNNGEKVSYEFYLYDFDRTKLYDQPLGNKDVILGRFHELDAVVDAIRYMKSGQEVELLVPSVLAYGTYGDSKKISNDVPLIIKLKLL